MNEITHQLLPCFMPIIICYIYNKLESHAIFLSFPCTLVNVKMARFWTRLFHSKKKKLPVIVFDDYAQSKHLKESYMYGKHLVRVDKLQNAYCRLQQQQQKSQAPFWRFMDPFVQTWYSELERICRTSQSALIMLNTQLEEVSNTICFIVSNLAFHIAPSNRLMLCSIHSPPL